MARIKYYTTCEVCGINIPTAQAKVIKASIYCHTHYQSLIDAGFDKLLGNPIQALAGLKVTK